MAHDQIETGHGGAPARIEGQAGELMPPDCAAEANRRWQLAERGHCSTLEHLWHAGRALKAAKAGLSHGEFGPWLAANFEASERNARRCMRLAEAWPGGWPEDLRVSLDKALRYLDAPKGPNRRDSADLSPNGGQVGQEEAEAAKRRLAKAADLAKVRDWATGVEVEKAAAASTAAELAETAEAVADAEKALSELRRGLKRHAKALRDDERAGHVLDVSACLAGSGQLTKRDVASSVGLSEEDAGRALQGLKGAGRVRVVRRKLDDGSWLSLWEASA